MINHNPLFDTKIVEKKYSKKDGVPVHYVCTTSLDLYGEKAYDIFFRETPHPEFGNRYFGLTTHSGKAYITDADKIEDLLFSMIKVNDEYHYSQHRHDFRSLGDVSIDGGRAYTRLVGNFKAYELKGFKVKDGQFIDFK